MNKFQKYIVENGEFLGAGADREAFLLNGKVYKIPFAENYQGRFEEEVYQDMPEKYKDFFPNVNWYGRIVEMDYVQVAGDTNFEENCEDYLSYEEGLFNDWCISDFVFQCEVDLPNVNLLYKLLDWLQDRGGIPEDMVNNTGNFGHINGQLKFVDWGWSNF